jgi:hypothetical protein
MSKPEVRSDFFFSYLVSDELIIKSLCHTPIIFFHKNRILIQRFLMTNGKEANLHNSVLIGN